MRIRWGWMTAALAMAVATVLVFGFRGGSCSSVAEETLVVSCETVPIGGPVGMTVLVTLGATLTAILARRAVRRDPE